MIFNMYEEQLAEFGSVEQKRAYVAERRTADPNWENTIFPRGKMARGEGLRTDGNKGLIHSHVGHSGNRGTGAIPGNSRKNRRH